MAETDVVLVLFAGISAASLLLLLLVYRMHRGNPRGGLVALGNLLVFVLLIGALLFLGEIYYRFVYDETDGLGVTLASGQWMQRHYRLNNLGVRDNIDYALGIAPGKRRISFLGDSFTAGYGIADVDDRFVNIVRRDHPGWEVHGMAWNGMNTGTLADRLVELRADGYELDQVVYVYMLNDLDDLIGELRAAIERLRAREPGFLVRRSYLLNTLYYRFNVGADEDMMDYFALLEQAYAAAPWQQQKARLEDLTRRVRESGGTLLVVTFPFFETLSSAAYGSIHLQLARHWETAGIPHLDLRSVFASLPQRQLTVNRHDSHPSRIAHRLAAEAVSDFLRREVRTEPLVSGAAAAL